MMNASIASAFYNYFQIIIADTPELKEEVYRIRYEVYCKELGYEVANKYPDGLENDVYDERSHHCLLLHRSSGIYAGCIRLVLPDPINRETTFPFESSCAGKLHQERVKPVFAHRHLLGEFSRLAVPEHFRRRKGEKHTQFGSLGMTAAEPEERRQFMHIPFGLYLAGAAIAVSSGLQGVVAMMEPRLARHLKRFGMIYQQVGDVVDHRGPRAPFYCSRATLFKHLDPEIREMLDDLVAKIPTHLNSRAV